MSGYPVASWQWRKLPSNDILGGGSELTLSSAELSDSGDYECTPSNSVGTGVPDIETFEVYGKFVKICVDEESGSNESAL